MDNEYSLNEARFSGAEWFNKMKSLNITILGAGGIGSWVSLFASRFYPESLNIIDKDVVDTVNLAGQAYRTGDIGYYKCIAMANIINAFGNHNVNGFNTEITENSRRYLTNIVLCGFDNMKARKDAFHCWASNLKACPEIQRKDFLFVDGRLTAEKFQVFTIRGNDYYSIKKYKEEYLFDDNEVEDAPCSYKQTTYCAAMLASLMCNSLVNFCCQDRPLLFFQEYDAATMILKQQS